MYTNMTGFRRFSKKKTLSPFKRYQYWNQCSFKKYLIVLNVQILSSTNTLLLGEIFSTPNSSLIHYLIPQLPCFRSWAYVPVGIEDPGRTGAVEDPPGVSYI